MLFRSRGVEDLKSGSPLAKTMAGESLAGHAGVSSRASDSPPPAPEAQPTPAARASDLFPFADVSVALPRLELEGAPFALTLPGAARPRLVRAKEK